jgi:hypothetical protein
MAPTIKRRVKKPSGIDFKKLLDAPTPKRRSRNRVAENFDPETFYVFERDGVTVGLLDKILSCPMRGTLAQIGGWTPVKFKGSLAFGNAVHYALEMAYSAFRDNTEPERLPTVAYSALKDHERDLKEELFEVNQQDPKIFEEVAEIYGTARVLLSKYFPYWEADFYGGIKWEGLEEVFSRPYQIQVPPPVGPISTFLRGKIDGRFNVGKGKRRTWLMDHKTKTHIDDIAIQDRLSYDLQTRFYTFNSWEIHGSQPAGMLYNVLRRPGLRRKATEKLPEFLRRVEEDITKRPDWYFVRYEVVLSPDDYEAFAVELESMLRVAYAWYRGSYHFKNSAACQTPYGTCDFARICGRQFYGGLYQRVDPFPELVQIGD